MKKIFLLLVLAISTTVFSQEVMTEGVVTSKQTMSSPNEQVSAQLAMIGEISTTTYFKGSMTRSETSNPMTGASVSIIDSEAKKMLMLIDNPMMGKTYAEQSFDASEDDLKDVTVEKGTETKTILGYVCQQYNVTMSKDGNTAKMEIYSTDKLAAVSQQTTAFGDTFKGYPLYMKIDMNQMGMDMTITSEVTEIKKESISDDKFDMTPPEGYKKTENLKGM